MLVTFRRDGMLLGWDAGILWFERGGVGFIGRTVSFVLPRGLMERQPTPSFEALVRVPRLIAKIGETVVGFVPLARGLSAEMTLARLDALPADAAISETILPPVSLHPDLLQRGLAVRRRQPLLVAISIVPAIVLFFPGKLLGSPPGSLVGLVSALIAVIAYFYILGFGQALPSSIRSQLPREPRGWRKRL